MPRATAIILQHNVLNGSSSNNNRRIKDFECIIFVVSNFAGAGRGWKSLLRGWGGDGAEHRGDGAEMGSNIAGMGRSWV